MDIRKEKAEHIAKKVAVLPQTPTCPDAITVRELFPTDVFLTAKRLEA